MNHENLNAFVGLCLDPGKVCLLTKFCTRGSLQVCLLPRDALRCPSACLSLCPSVRPSVTFVYCIQTAEDIVKLLSRPSILIILVFLSPCVGIQFQGKRKRQIHLCGKNFVVVRAVNQVRRPVISVKVLNHCNCTVRICLYHILLTSRNYSFVVKYYCIVTLYLEHRCLNQQCSLITLGYVTNTGCIICTVQ